MEPKLVSLTELDVEDCLSLTREVNWNQTKKDWLLMLNTGLGIGLRDDKKLGATAVLLPFESHVAWISMVAVTESWRRNGFATRLTEKCVEMALARGLVPMLDATPDGSTVYERIGFTRTDAIYRYTRVGSQTISDDQSSGTTDRLHRLTPAHTDAIVQLDRQMFGDFRKNIIANLIGRNISSAAVLADGSGATGGFIIGRPGTNFHQAGPLCAQTLQDAIELLAPVLEMTEGKICIDIPECHASFRAFVERHGFEIQRPFYRMYYGASDPGLSLDLCYAIAGPELG